MYIGYIGYQLKNIHADVQNHYYLTILTLLRLLSGISLHCMSRAISTKLNCVTIC